jgi:lysophospholipase L1-like esterase
MLCVGGCASSANIPQTQCELLLMSSKIHNITKSNEDKEESISLSSLASHLRMIRCHRVSNSTALVNLSHKKKMGAEDFKIALVGDSDIERWSRESSLADHTWKLPIVSINGKSGAVLGDIVPMAEELLLQQMNQTNLIVIGCAGENDIGDGIFLDKTINAMKDFIDAIFVDHHKGQSSCRRHLIFLGPKFEPWLDDDPSYKKKYTKLSRALQKCCETHAHTEFIYFVDCITMFCGDTANIPGAVLGGKAKADYKYFCSDKLHLSSHGYRIWEQEIGKCIQKIVDKKITSS